MPIFEFGPEPTGMATPVSTWPTPDFTGGSLAVTSTGRVYFLMANIDATATGVAFVAPGSSTPTFVVQHGALTNLSYVATTL